MSAADLQPGRARDVLTLITAAFGSAWAVLAPWIGPLLASLIPAWGRARNRISGISGGLAPFAGVVVLGVAAGLAGWMALKMASKPPGPPTVLVSEVELNRQRAATEALTAANAKLQRAYEQRAQDAERLQTALTETERRLEEARDDARQKSSDPARPVFAADDPWLRAKRSEAR